MQSLIQHTCKIEVLLIIHNSRVMFQFTYIIITYIYHPASVVKIMNVCSPVEKHSLLIKFELLYI